MYHNLPAPRRPSHKSPQLSSPNQKQPIAGMWNSNISLTNLSILALLILIPYYLFHRIRTARVSQSHSPSPPSKCPLPFCHFRPQPFPSSSPTTFLTIPRPTPNSQPPTTASPPPPFTRATPSASITSPPPSPPRATSACCASSSASFSARVPRLSRPCWARGALGPRSRGIWRRC
jgi:hypothetical protein